MAADRRASGEVAVTRGLPRHDGDMFMVRMLQRLSVVPGISKLIHG
jgi:hypothetical protein